MAGHGWGSKKQPPSVLIWAWRVSRDETQAYSSVPLFIAKRQVRFLVQSYTKPHAPLPVRPIDPKEPIVFRNPESRQLICCSTGKDQSGTLARVDSPES